MQGQRELIERKNWDFLVILDACRYDYFKEIYRDYLKGKLKKVKSPASTTLEMALNSIKKIARKGFVITSDHGERLGLRDKGLDHPDENLEKLRTIPWLEVK